MKYFEHVVQFVMVHDHIVGAHREGTYMQGQARSITTYFYYAVLDTPRATSVASKSIYQSVFLIDQRWQQPKYQRHAR
jgi:hypothetical protein